MTSWRKIFCVYTQRSWLRYSKAAECESSLVFIQQSWWKARQAFTLMSVETRVNHNSLSSAMFIVCNKISNRISRFLLCDACQPGIPYLQRSLSVSTTIPSSACFHYPRVQNTRYYGIVLSSGWSPSIITKTRWRKNLVKERILGEVTEVGWGRGSSFIDKWNANNNATNHADDWITFWFAVQ